MSASVTSARSSRGVSSGVPPCQVYGSPVSGWVPKQMNCCPSPRISILCELPLGASKQADIFGNGVAVRSGSARLGKRPKRTGITPRSPNSSLAHLLGELGGLGVGDVDVDRRRVRREAAGIGAGPRPHLGGTGTGLVLPPGDRGALAHARDRRESVGLHGKADIDGGHCGFPPVGERPPAARADGPRSYLNFGISSSRRSPMGVSGGSSGLATPSAGRRPTTTNIGVATQPTRESRC